MSPSDVHEAVCQQYRKSQQSGSESEYPATKTHVKFPTQVLIYKAAGKNVVCPRNLTKSMARSVALWN
eukprot:1146078-Pelagomonas_calceolata.AAC.13